MKHYNQTISQQAVVHAYEITTSIKIQISKTLCRRSPKFRSIWNDDVTCCYGNEGCFDSLVVSLKQLVNHIW